MARKVEKLSAVGLLKKSPGSHLDGGGLRLQVTPSGARSWIFRYMVNGRSREMGLGPLHTVSLAQARERARDARRLLLQGVDPIQARDADKAAKAAAAAGGTTFQACAEDYIEAKAAEWQNAKHRDQWSNTLVTYAFPVIGSLPVSAIDTDLVLKVLTPIWGSKTETASRVRQRIESVLDAASARKLRTGENPARWRGHLDELLPKPTKVKKVRHHPALPYVEVPVFMASLRQQTGSAPLALEFAILMAARTGEVIGAMWDEFDLEAKVWTVPAERMKARKQHRVPLSDRAIEILEDLQPLGGTYVFPGLKDGTPLSNMSLLAVLKRMGRADLTTHGFRSTFRDWCAEVTHFPYDVAEMALAHTIKSKTESAYLRGDLFAKRADLMKAWAEMCMRDPSARAAVVPMRRTSSRAPAAG